MLTPLQHDKEPWPKDIKGRHLKTYRPTSQAITIHSSIVAKPPGLYQCCSVASKHSKSHLSVFIHAENQQRNIQTRVKEAEKDRSLFRLQIFLQLANFLLGLSDELTSAGHWQKSQPKPPNNPHFTKQKVSSFILAFFA